MESINSNKKPTGQTNTQVKSVSKPLAYSAKGSLEVKRINQTNEDTKVDISEQSKDLKKKLTATEKALKIQSKKFGNMQKPGIFFMSGFDWFGAGSVKGNYDGIRDMSEAVDGAEHFTWDQQEEMIKEIKKRDVNQPIILIGHSFGGDGVIEVAQQLNTLDNGFRKIDLMVTLDSVGFDNDVVPQNVKKNLNYLATGPYHFLNDGPNIAANYKRTEVENYLRAERHSELDDLVDIQMQVLEEIGKVV